tara:strand:- start:932 stop:2509 length:1578 start_codon:yes stop_codon:yes gene_type:complete
MLTKKEIIAEILRSGKDPNYFVNNYVKISHPIEGLIPFKTYEFQKQLLGDFNDYRFNVILKARQLGISTITAAYAAWLMLFYRDKNIVVMATKFGTASNLVKKVKAIIKNLPEWIQVADISVDNRASFELSNGSQIKAISTSGDAGRSEALSLLIVDEAAHVEGMSELWTGLYPTLSTGGRCIALSTPNGVGNWFHKTYIQAETGENDFFPTLLPWDAHPDRDKEWFEKETRNMSRRQIAQELECNFNTSGETVFHSDDIDRVRSATQEPKYRTGVDRNLWIWESYQPTNSYMISADVARGDASDYSAFLVFKLETMEIVAEYHGKITIDFFSELLFNTGKEYGNCLMVVENNSVGFSVLEKLREKEYPNIYYSIKSTHEFIDPIQAQHHNSAVAGFSTTNKTRPLIIAKLEEFIRNRLITIYSKRMLSEMTTFIWNNGKPQAQRSYHDDLIMSCAIGCWVRDTALVANKQEIEYSKATLQSVFKANSEFNTSIPGQVGYKPVKFSDKMKEHEKHAKEFFWLYKG